MNQNLLVLFLMIMPMLGSSQSLSEMSYNEYQKQLDSVQLDGLTIRYVDRGEGPVVLLVHGIPTSSWLWRDIADELVSTGYRVLAPDMIGMGLSERSQSEERIGFEGQSKMLLSLLNHLKVSTIHLGVHDVGGPWSWHLLLAEKVDVSSLILFNTILYMEGFDPPMSVRKGSFREKLVRWAYNTSWVGKTIVKSTLRKGTEQADLPKEACNGYTEPVEWGLGWTVTRFFTSFDELENLCEQTQAHLKASRIPICAVWGKEDPFLLGHKQLPLAMRDLNLPKENVHIMHEAGHFVQEDRPKGVMSIILPFLAQQHE